MGSLLDDVRRAKEAGLTYGAYKAQQNLQEETERVTLPIPTSRRRKKRYTDQEAFAMWQEGKSDAQIGAALGVSRQIIQRWRDTMEIPSTFMRTVDTSAYELVEMKSGIFVVKREPGATIGPGDPGYN